MEKFRPSAVPLVTVDPYFSIWSASDNLYDDVTHHWTGRRNPMTAGVFIDGKFYLVMGQNVPHSDRRSFGFMPYIPQVDLEITATRTKYKFKNEVVEIALIFTTPLLIDRLDILSRPVSYIEYNIEVIDGKEHKVKFQFDISAECAIDDIYSSVKFGKTKNSVFCGNSEQNVLSRSGDSVCMEWGYIHIADTDTKILNGRDKKLPDNREEYDINGTYKVFDKYPYMVLLKDELKGVITLGYDDINPIEYFGEKLDDYYKKYFSSFNEMLDAAVSEYEEVKRLCIAFDNRLAYDARKISDKYEKIASLAYRQVVAAHKIAEDKDGNLLFLSKECHSNGCIGTLDVTYPSIPMFLKYNPSLIWGMLKPIIKFAKSDKWKYDFAPHDVGQFPLANGQVYGLENGELLEKFQMPVEECGNMMICTAAAVEWGADFGFAKENKEILKKWADYLVKYGYNPENQLCTDDFAGHLAYNCNLSLKGILGIAAYGKLFSEQKYIEIAKEYAKQWEKDASNEMATKLAFDKDNSWSIKYNIVWDRLLGINIFDRKISEREVNFYMSKMNKYGVPLDSREDYTKFDWLFWSTAMTDNKEYQEAVIDAAYRYISETADRVPISDWYYTTNGRMVMFQNRTVLGGIFIKVLFF